MMHTISSNKNTVWPYPRLLAHRGAGKAAPENTLAALRKGAAQGYQMFEYDVQLSRDEVAVLIHDYSLKRTAQVEGNVSDKSLAELLHYDFGAWHSAPYIGEPILTLAGVANFSIPQQLHSNIEIKAAPGLEALTGARVAQQAQQLWRSEEHTSELQSRGHLVCRLLLEKRKDNVQTDEHSGESREI